MMFPKKQIYKSKANYEKYRREHPYCELSGEPAFMGPHHIKFRSQQGGDEDENLIALNEFWHKLAHGKYSKIVRLLLKLWKSHQSQNQE